MFANAPKESLKPTDYQKQSQTPVNNIPIKNDGYNDINNIKPTSVINNPFQFTPMQLFYLGGMNKRFCHR